jgi:hypothetical protein
VSPLGTAFLIGMATLTTTGFSWRAVQIGSTAAFDDRQSISETVRVAQQTIERTIAVAGDAREYARYRADYGVAAALDQGRPGARSAVERVIDLGQLVEVAAQLGERSHVA